MLTLRCVAVLQHLFLMLQGKLIAGINSRVQLYDWQLQKDSSRGLVAGAGQSGLVLALYLACRGDFIVVGKPSSHLICVSDTFVLRPIVEGYCMSIPLVL